MNVFCLFFFCVLSCSGAPRSCWCHRQSQVIQGILSCLALLMYANLEKMLAVTLFSTFRLWPQHPPDGCWEVVLYGICSMRNTSVYHHVPECRGTSQHIHNVSYEARQEMPTLQEDGSEPDKSNFSNNESQCHCVDFRSCCFCTFWRLGLHRLLVLLFHYADYDRVRGPCGVAERQRLRKEAPLRSIQYNIYTFRTHSYICCYEPLGVEIFDNEYWGRKKRWTRSCCCCTNSGKIGWWRHHRKWNCCVSGARKPGI